MDGIRSVTATGSAIPRPMGAGVSAEGFTEIDRDSSGENPSGVGRGSSTETAAGSPTEAAVHPSVSKGSSTTGPLPLDSFHAAPPRAGLHSRPRRGPLAPGVTYSEGTFQGARYHLVRINPAQASVRPKPYLATREQGDTVLAIDRTTGSVATINGTFFDTAHPGRTIYGDVKTDDAARPASLSKKRTYWAVTPEGSHEMAETERTGVDPKGNPIFQIPSARFKSYRYVLGGGGRLVRDGRKASAGAGDNDEQFLPDVLARRNRSAIGFTSSSDAFWMVSCDSPGWTPEETADFFVTLGAEQAMFLDGGGSTEMVVSDRIITPLSAGAERAMPTAVVLA